MLIAGKGPIEKPTCFNCKNAEIDGGYSGSYDEPPHPPYAMCELPDMEEIGEENSWDENIMPEKCNNRFDPIEAGKCCNCQKAITDPEWSWTLWADGLVEWVPVCSEQCKHEIEDKTAKEIAEMNLTVEEYNKQLFGEEERDEKRFKVD